MKLEGLIAECNRNGFLILNLFQIKDGVWQANLQARYKGPKSTKGKNCWTCGIYHEFGRGVTAKTALIDALLKARNNNTLTELKPYLEKVK